MIEVDVLGVSVLGPGLPGWAESVAVLTGVRDWTFAVPNPPPPALLPANERRRAGIVVRLAMAVAEEAVAMAGLPRDKPRGVFASSCGDGVVLHALLSAMTASDGQISPTQFHNSVHNAVAANWTIGTGSMRPATSIGMHDDTFAAGLLKAAAETSHEGEALLFCAYDAPLPEPLNAKQPIAFPFALALVIAPSGRRSGAPRGRPDHAPPPIARLTVSYAAGPPEPAGWLPAAAGPRALATGNPAARGLRLLEALAGRSPDSFSLPLSGGRVNVAVTP